ncbi:MAG: hypothetical protein V7K27_23890 [Nostoc sp.]
MSFVIGHLSLVICHWSWVILLVPLFPLSPSSPSSPLSPSSP